MKARTCPNKRAARAAAPQAFAALAVARATKASAPLALKAASATYEDVAYTATSSRALTA